MLSRRSAMPFVLALALLVGFGWAGGGRNASGVGGRAGGAPAAAPARGGAGTPAAQSRPGLYSDPIQGFSMASPAFPEVKQDRVVVAIFQAAPEDGFTPNVTVMVDPVKTTRVNYLDASMKTMAATNPKATVRSLKELQVSAKDAELLDYDATMAGRRLRFLQLLVVADDRVYILTCTAPVETYANYQAQFQKCLDSFRLDK